MNPRDLNSMLIGYEGERSRSQADPTGTRPMTLSLGLSGGVIQWDMKEKTAVNTFELTLPPGG
jgi:hypothetical protein